jgi:hypothetical protein
MEIYDKAGRFIGYVLQSSVSKTPLEDTRQVGERKREQWLREIARRSLQEKWTYGKAKQVISEEIKSSNLSTAKSQGNAISEAMLAADGSVRGDFDRLVEVRDESWQRETNFVRRVRHGPSQVLVDLLRRQSREDERTHAASADAYLRYLHRTFPNG